MIRIIVCLGVACIGVPLARETTESGRLAESALEAGQYNFAFAPRIQSLRYCG